MFNSENTVGFTATQLAELNRRYDQMLAAYGDPNDTISSTSDPHFFGPIKVRDYVARRVLAEFRD